MRREVERQPGSERRWGIALMTALCVSLGMMVLLPLEEPAPETAPAQHAAAPGALLPPAPLASPPPAPLAPPAQAPDAGTEDGDAAAAQAAFWVWPLLEMGHAPADDFDD